MKKRFNTTGVCVPRKHYMVDISDKLNKIEEMVHLGEYFIINRPRQYGKTTILSQLSKNLNNDYFIIRTSFEGIGDAIFESEESFCFEIFNILSSTLKFTNKERAHQLQSLGKGLKNLNEVSDKITEFILSCDKEVILLIDEVDKSSNNQLFLSFLGMLRNKYLLSNEELDRTFYSVILAGVHDVKNLKIKLRPHQEKKYNSPWNIAVNFDIDMSFSSNEIETMLNQYCEESKISMNTKDLSETLYYYTSGYPFLVSRLCKIIDETILNNKKEQWTSEHIKEAMKIILKENNTLFDDLIKNLENNKEIYDLVLNLLIKNKLISFNIDNPIINLGVVYGIFRKNDELLKIHNRIFEQRIYNYLSSKIETENGVIQYDFRSDFIKETNELDFEKILLRYQQFMKENYSDKDSRFLEREGRLLFLAFLKPIINGTGFDFKEAQISQEKRLDVVVTYDKYKYVSELKIWRGEEYHKKGIIQLCDYLDIEGLNKGYLVIYDFNKNKEYKQEKIYVEDKEIFIVWV